MQYLSRPVSGWLIVVFMYMTTALNTALAATGSAAAIEAGKQIAFDRKKGNCLSCHAMDDGISPGSIGPALASMKARYPNEAELREQIWDARINNPHTIMPPFGKHRILTPTEIEQLLEYLYTL